MTRRVSRALLVWGLCLLLCAGPGEMGSPPAQAEPPPAVTERSYEIFEEYLSAEEALRLCFPETDRVGAAEVRLTGAQAARVAALAGHPLWEEAFSVHRAFAADGRLLGYGVVTEEVGRFHVITFLVGVTPEGAVRRVEVLVYRESRGGEVRHRRFLRQYEGKTVRHPIRLNRDILNITGATLSVRAMNRGVRKVLGVIEAAYAPEGSAGGPVPGR